MGSKFFLEEKCLLGSQNDPVNLDSNKDFSVHQTIYNKKKNMLFIDISSDEKKLTVYNLFQSFNKKGDIYEYFNVSDSKRNIEYINRIAEEIGFNFNIYKERKRKYCLVCGKELRGSQKKFCSSSCSAKYNNKRRLKKVRQTKNYNKPQTPTKKRETINKQPYEKECEFCHGLYKTYNANCRFCSDKCRSESRKADTVKSWLNGQDHSTGVNHKLPYSIREYVYKRANFCCEECGFEGYNKKTGKTILQIHHKDGDSLNNTEENLQALCPNCHAMTENYMGLNRGKSTRIKRYSDGE